MMLGTIAQTYRDASAGPLPEGATAFLDFVNGLYYIDGEWREISSILTGYDADEISSLGMHFGGEEQLPLATGSLLSQLATALAAGCTLVFTVNYVNAPYNYLIGFYDGTNEGDSDEYISVGNGAAIGAGTSFSIGDQDAVQLIHGGSPSAGMHVVAVTLNRDEGGGTRGYAMSVDGASATTDTATYSPVVPAVIPIGHDNDGDWMDNAYIRSITLYPAVEPTELPALSAA